jgi:tetratricopeptide (TPR) repeat protein
MKLILSSAILASLAGAPIVSAQTAPAGVAQTSPGAQGAAASTEATRSDAYYYFTMGHLQEDQYELNNDPDMATQAIESYKKALELEPNSAVIMVRLAEVNADSQHIRDAVIQAEQALKIDPNNVDAHRILARIYVRTLGDVNAGQVQQESLAKAIEQLQAILKIKPNDTYSALWLARLYRFENQHAEAESVLRGVLKQEPDNGPALEQLSQILVDEGRSQEAITLLTRAAGDTASPDVYGLLGDAYSQLKDYPRAEEAYRQAVDGDPDDPGHRHGLAEALLQQDKYAESLEQFKKLSELEPDSSENYLRMAELQRRLGQFDQAQASLTKAKQLAPDSLEVLYNQALLYEDEDRFSDAIKLFSDAIAGVKSQGSTANPNALPILYEQLGQAYMMAHNYPAAIETYQDMGKLGPEAESHARLLLIEAYRSGHDLDQAITEAKKGLEDSPNDPLLTRTLALLYGEKSDPAQGMKLLQGMLQGNSSDQEVYINMAQVQESAHQYGEAEQYAEKADQLAQQPQDKHTAWFMLGSIYERQKKYELAEEQFRKVLEQDPNNDQVLNYYGYMLADRGVRIDEATSLIERAVKEEPNNGAYLDSLGWAYYRQNKLPEAEEYLRRAIVREGDDPTILSHLAAVYLKMGQTESAADFYEKSLAQWQKASPADYEPDKVSDVEAQLRTLKRRLAQKASPDAAKPQ